MTGNVRVKICGLTRLSDVADAVSAGASYVGFVFFPKSPRNVSLNEARTLALSVPSGIAKVALTVDADDAFLDELLAAVPIDVLQLHGHEIPDRVAAVRARYGLPVMKAVGIAHERDLHALDEYGRVADMLLVEAKPPKDATRPGGNGLVFDWNLIAGRQWPVPWMLAGGLTVDNVADALHRTGARQVDLSSGVERSPGVKDANKMADFIAAARGEARCPTI